MVKIDAAKTAKFGNQIDAVKQVFFIPNALLVNDGGNWVTVYGEAK